jgi:RNA polymerase sigma factor (sigma-70 family)
VADVTAGTHTLTAEFAAARGHLRSVGYRMLGSPDDADDAVQETWLRASRAGLSGVRNVPGWLTTILSRICLDMLRARQRRPEELTDLSSPDAIVALPPPGEPAGPEEEAMLAESVGLAMLVVLDRLGPAERVAYVLHDMFTVPYVDIARVLDRSPDAAKKLASRARLRVHAGPADPPADYARQRRATEAFLAAARAGDFGALLAVLDPDVVRRADQIVLPAGVPAELRGADAVLAEAKAYNRGARSGFAALVDGVPALLLAPRGRLRLVVRLTFTGDRVSALDIIADPARLAALHIAILP